MVEVALVVLLGLLGWQMSQLLQIQKQIRIELVTARWHTQQRMRALERQVEREGEGALSLGGEPTDGLE